MIAIHQNLGLHDRHQAAFHADGSVARERMGVGVDAVDLQRGPEGGDAAGVGRRQGAARVGRPPETIDVASLVPCVVAALIVP